MYFVGRNDYQLDDRKRVPIPPLYRAAFETGGYLSMGNDPCIQLHTLESFAATAKIIEAIPAETPEGDDARRAFFGNVGAVQKDAQGRITLGAEFLAHAGITKDVLVVGVGDKLEIWDRATYQTRETDAFEARRRATARQQSRQAEA
ncbi:MAG: division/cell wall cluster transcriptional repressor MraZ [Dehalococcoidia bacterium]